MDKGKIRLEAHCLECKRGGGPKNGAVMAAFGGEVVLQEYYVAFLDGAFARGENPPVIWGIGHTYKEAVEDGAHSGAYDQEIAKDGGDVLTAVKCSKRLYDAVRSKGGEVAWSLMGGSAFLTVEVREKRALAKDLSEYTAQVVGVDRPIPQGSLIEAFPLKSSPGLYDQVVERIPRILSITPEAAANFIHQVTHGTNYADQERISMQAFPTALRVMACVRDIPEFEDVREYSEYSRTATEELGESRKVAQFMADLGAALLVWCNEQEELREEARKKKKEKEATKRKKQQKAKAKHKTDDLYEESVEDEDDPQDE